MYSATRSLMEDQLAMMQMGSRKALSSTNRIEIPSTPR